jgi:uncharacterized RDD family membrane protein YckC
MTETQPQVPWDAPPDAAGPAPGIEFAAHGARLVAYILDGLILTVAFLVAFFIGTITLFAGSSIDWTNVEDSTMDPAAVGGFVVLIIVFVVVSIAYFPFFWARGGQTPGMRPFGLRVVRDRDGGRIGWGAAILRLIGMYVASVVFYLGFIWILIDKRRRGWHDLIAGTVVIHRP